MGSGGMEAGILGIIQASDVPIKAMYDRKNMRKMTYSVIEKMVERRE